MNLKFVTVRFVGFVCFCLLAAVSRGASEIPMGMPEKDLIALKGQPTGKMSAGAKAIYRWPDATVTLEDGKVTSVENRDPKKEENDAAKRSKLGEEEKAKIANEKARQEQALAQEQANKQRDAAAIAKGAKERKDQQAKYDAYDAAVKARDTRVLSLTSEIDVIRQDLQRASASGDKSRSLNLNFELQAKMKELDSVRHTPLPSTK